MRKLFENGNDHPILMQRVDVIRGLVKWTSPMALLPKIIQAFTAVGVLVHTDHHRQSGGGVWLCADSTISQLLLVAQHHLSDGLL